MVGTGIDSWQGEASASGGGALLAVAASAGGEGGVAVLTEGVGAAGLERLRVDSSTGMLAQNQGWDGLVRRTVMRQERRTGTGGISFGAGQVG